MASVAGRDSTVITLHDVLCPQPSRGALRRCLRTAIVVGLLATACLVGVAEATPADSTLLEFRDESYALNPVVRVSRLDRDEPAFLDYTWEVDNPVSRQNWHIARVRVVGLGVCREPGRDCN